MLYLHFQMLIFAHLFLSLVDVRLTDCIQDWTTQKGYQEGYFRDTEISSVLLSFSFYGVALARYCIYSIQHGCHETNVSELCLDRCAKECYNALTVWITRFT